MVSQRELFAFIPGARSEAARAVASTPAPPRECAVYLVQEAVPQLTPDRVSVRAKSAKHPQAPAPSAEARPSTAPLNTTREASPASIRNTVPRSVPKSSSVSAPSRIPSSVPPSIHHSVPERPQPAPRVPQTSCATRSRPRWPRSCLFHRTSARMHQHVQPPPSASLCTPFPRPAQSVKPCTEPRSVESSSNKQPAIRQATALRLPSPHAKAPRRNAPRMRNASATLVQRPCDLQDSLRTYTSLAAPRHIALAEDWGQSIFQ
ncbi:hypothetical protein EDB83DRAFT_2464558 [Lactarius deliciosus]|nr:hypothetical protein EDB83DRAFT_2464558 [Lactarius deliciosus]